MPRVRPTGIAFRSPSANIRHRFGGHLRAARMRDPSAAIRSCIATPRATTGRVWGIGAESPDRSPGFSSGSNQVVSTGDLEETE